MKAWIQPALGVPPRLDTLPDPVPGRGGAGSGRGSRYQLRRPPDGRGPLSGPGRAALRAGLELAGTVEALGPGVTAPLPGTRVAAHVRRGAFAERACVPADRLVVLPDTMPFPVAAGFLIAYGTSHLALTHLARLAPGETLFVTGAAGGVGLTAVEIGRALGARVIAQVRGAEKAAIARAAGAETVIDSTEPDLKAALRPWAASTSPMTPWAAPASMPRCAPPGRAGGCWPSALPGRGAAGAAEPAAGAQHLGPRDVVGRLPVLRARRS